MTPKTSLSCRPRPRKEPRTLQRTQDDVTASVAFSPWDQLPRLALVEVLKHLPDEDRANVSKMCHNWREAFLDPCLWRRRHFDFGGSKANGSGLQALQFVQQHGRCLQDVTVKCAYLTSNTCESIAQALQPFLEALQSANLSVFRLQCLELDRFWRYVHLRMRTARLFVSFFETQSYLKTLEVTNAHFDGLQGVDVLQAAGKAAGHSVEHLYLDDFFHSRLDLTQVPRYINTMKQFSNVRDVSLNYCCLSDEIVSQWSDALRGILSRLSIKVLQDEPHNHTITTGTWSKICSSCPLLEVQMVIYDLGPSALVVPILSPVMPLVRFRYRSGYDDDMELRLNRTFSHLALNFGRCLFELDLDLDNLQDNVNESLVTLVGKCQSLEYLGIRAIMQVQTAERICRHSLEPKSRLKHVEIVLREMSYTDSEELLDLIRTMTPLIEHRGVTVILKDALYE